MLTGVCSHQDQLLQPAQLGDPPTDDEAVQGDEAREARCKEESAERGARPKGREGRADPQAYRMEGLRLQGTGGRTASTSRERGTAFTDGHVQTHSTDGALRIRRQLYTGYVAIWDAMRPAYTTTHGLSIGGRRKIMNKNHKPGCSVDAARYPMHSYSYRFLPLPSRADAPDSTCLVRGICRWSS
jgi:hypothetical protein